MSHFDTYQDLYSRTPYGQASRGNCPGVFYLRHYLGWLIGPVFDFGCGTGDTVLELRKRGLDAMGMDQVILNNDMLIGDVSKPMYLKRYGTSICIDCFEHMTDDEVRGVLENMVKARRQVIAVHSGPSSFRGPAGEDLHINQKTPAEWKAIIAEYTDIMETIVIADYYHIFLCTRGRRGSGNDS